MVLTAPAVERLELAGPAGAIEALLETPKPAGLQAFGVICHPHPQYGGTLDNKVVHTLARTFNEFGVPTLRFNFRGVGASAGQFADGLGETEDALAVVAWGRKHWPDAAVWLAGFSFGAAVAIRTAAQIQPARLVAVAPAISRVPLTDLAPIRMQWQIVMGDADELVDPAEVQAWAARQSPQPQLTWLPGGQHLFHGRLVELRSAVSAYLKN